MPTKLSNFFLGFGCLSWIIGCVFFIYFLINKSILTAIVYAVIFFVGLIIFIVLGANLEDKQKKKHENFLSTLKPNAEQFQETQSFIAFDMLSKISMDEQNEHIYLWTPENQSIQNLKDVFYGMPYRVFAYKYTDILAVEISEDNALISTISRRSQSARYLLDGLQAVAGELPKKDSKKQQVNAVELKIIVNDRIKPVHLIRFYSDPAKKLQKNSEEYRKVQNEIQHWFSVLQLIIKRADQLEGNFTNDETKMVPPIHAQTEGIQSNSKNLNDDTIENERIVKSQLLSVLTQVLNRKVASSSLFNSGSEPEKSIDQPSSYFDKLLEKNREQLRGNSNED